MNFAVIGASAGLGRALAEECARRNHNVVLVSSDGRDLLALASHLRLMYGVTAESVSFRAGAADERNLARSIEEKLSIDGLLFPMGLAFDSDTGLLPVDTASVLVSANFLTQAALVSCFWTSLASRPQGYIVGFGSVAALRGRRRNVIYAAAKRALASYFESLRHMAVGTSIRVHFYNLGYLDTQQTYGKRLPFPKAQPADVAKFVLNRLDRDEPAAFYPQFWRAVSLIVRNLPWPLFKRMDF